MKLKDYMCEEKVSASAMAKALGVATSTITRIADGQEPSPDNAKAIVRFTNRRVTLDDLYQIDPPADAAE
jgi:DNA-binding transcriptional regulator YdaS (Cro superfamily)